MQIESSRMCNKCEIERAITEFGPSKKYRGGRLPICRSCARARAKVRRDRPKIDPGTRKVCRTCSRSRPIDEFGINIANRDGRTFACAFCRSLAHVPLDPRVRRDRYLRSKYDIGLVEYEAMLIQQDGRCAVCIDPLGGRSPHLDHNHQTGKVRGLLCSNCNTAMGLLRENPLVMLSMVRYIANHELAIGVASD